MTRRTGVVAAAAAVLVLLAAIVTGCGSDDTAAPAATSTVVDTNAVNSDDFDKVLSECQILPPATIAKAAGGTSAATAFHGAICRWVIEGAGITDVTFNWFEWGDYNVEKDTAKRLGFTTENVSIQSQAAFTQRDPKRPKVCGVTSKAPGRGLYTWWVEPHGSGPDGCQSATKLMELVLTGAR